MKAQHKLAAAALVAVAATSMACVPPPTPAPVPAGCYDHAVAGYPDITFNGVLGENNAVQHMTGDGSCSIPLYRLTLVLATDATEANEMCDAITGSVINPQYPTDLDTFGYTGLTDLWLCLPAEPI